MKIPFDIFDHIFGFLIAHPASLVACSEAHHVFSRMVEKYRYYHIITHTGPTYFKYGFEPSHLIKLLSDKPRIANYVRVLQVELEYRSCASEMAPYLEQIAAILSMFPLVLECIVLVAKDIVFWRKDLSQSFRKAVEDCFHSLTLQEVHVSSLSGFPLSMLDSHANIDCFSLCHGGPPPIFGHAYTTYPQLKYLSVERIYGQGYLTYVSAWAIHHIAELQSLKCDYSSGEAISELLEICSDTLNNLDLNFGDLISRAFATVYHLDNSERKFRSDGILMSINLSSLPHLQHLTIRALIFFDIGDTSNGCEDCICITYLPAAVEILKTASSLRQLTIEINIDLNSSYNGTSPCATIDDVDLSPLTSLVELPAWFHHIDLHFTNCIMISHAKILSLLADYRGLMKLIEQGVLVIHPDKAPTFLDMGGKSTIVQYPRANRTWK